MSKYIREFKTMHMVMKIFFVLGFPLIAADIALTISSLSQGDFAHAALHATIAMVWTWFVARMWSDEVARVQDGSAEGQDEKAGP